MKYNYSSNKKIFTQQYIHHANVVIGMAMGGLGQVYVKPGAWPVFQNPRSGLPGPYIRAKH
jgi:hypothetical protein